MNLVLFETVILLLNFIVLVSCFSSRNTSLICCFMELKLYFAILHYFVFLFNCISAFGIIRTTIKEPVSPIPLY